jgi:hypothetical protein
MKINKWGKLKIMTKLYTEEQGNFTMENLPSKTNVKYFVYTMKRKERKAYGCVRKHYGIVMEHLPEKLVENCLNYKQSVYGRNLLEMYEK